ncbi:MAG: YqgE/AlgH family protein [Rhodobacteraceae bacterium]|nr:YqgE/AlgH family protein [Alphaproteobacteria bacterium]MBT8475680.1 YqgE/AlgH family protein [Alphaproteobacteria bacterium]NNF72828.1 YqgE/AlgH family protein [Paracoccaceae bacterium]NNK68169.1 YqgE/AlgH family protein [Paracoccaceae bacterium]
MNDLTGKLLIAMPGMGDPRFDHSVIFLCEHSAKGAMGLIVNKPTPELPARELLGQLGIDAQNMPKDLCIYFGGPVEHGRGFVLHSEDYRNNSSTLHVTDQIGLTATLDILQDIADGRGPEKVVLALGYAGWGPGQLEREFQDNGWLTCDGDADVVFHPDNDAKWTAALKSLGVDALTLSAEGGHA